MFTSWSVAAVSSQHGGNVQMVSMSASAGSREIPRHRRLQPSYQMLRHLRSLMWRRRTPSQIAQSFVDPAGCRRFSVAQWSPPARARGQTTINKKAPVHYVIPINDISTDPLKMFKKNPPSKKTTNKQTKKQKKQKKTRTLRPFNLIYCG